MAESKSKSAKSKKGWQHTSISFIKALGVSLILALMIKTSVVEAFVIPTGSMENALYGGDYILGNKFVYGMKLPIPLTNIRLPAIENPKPGDIVIFKYPLDQRQNYIKRVVAVGGQSVEIRNKDVYVDGLLVPLPPEGKHEDPNIVPADKSPQWGISIRDNMPRIIVPEGKLFVMGDNRDKSFDSRFWGFVDRNLVIGRALIVLWSWEYTAPLPSSRSFSTFDLWRYNITNFPELVQHIRWGRVAKVIV